MATIGNVIDRIYRDFLARATDTPTIARLDGAHNSSVTTLTLHVEDLTQEELSLIEPGITIEGKREQMRVTSDINPTTGEVTVARAQNGTAAEVHTDGEVITIAPAYARQSVFDALADAVDALWPELFTTELEVVAGEAVAAYPNAAYGDVIAATDQFGNTIDVHVRGHYGEVDTGKAIAFPAEAWHSDVWVLFKKRLTRPTTEDQELSDLGIRDSWVQLLVIDTVTNLVAGHELDRFTLEYLTEAVEESGKQSGQALDVAAGLERYRLRLLSRAKRALYDEFPIRVEWERVI